MLIRFSLYGFLKNLRLFEAFLVLALRERGLDYLDIGLLIAVREIAVNVFEVPSGALADALGRRRCMVMSMASYLVAYGLLGMSSRMLVLGTAMVCYGVGDAFRTGTHKAMIYAWLRSQGRESERTKVYGFTRSWSKVGSALSALLAGGLVLLSGNYVSVFMWSMAPAALNLINLATYPAFLDGEPGSQRGLAAGWTTMLEGLKEVRAQPAVRRLIWDSMSMEGCYAVMKDYLQPIVQQAALALPVMLAASGFQRTAVLGGIAYALLFALASVASRQAHRWERWSKSTETAIRRLRLVTALGYGTLAVCLLGGLPWLAMGVFVLMGMLQNLWRPIHIGRFDEAGQQHTAATTLSIEAQAKAITAALLAPLIGWIVDRIAAGQAPIPTYCLWPVALCGIPILLRWAVAGKGAQQRETAGKDILT